ncbi:hypothetical protein B9Z55_027525 [Caenorhabditis nigoni]|uniref:Uncharacterized protein n=1 Tax=Caenorhabditis nigoni TaxID=1611254 RepID=A0A2G5SFJ0_9PELO|nr:hypothetical protein B9Z55_027525 [Caenorhabditis nigoni]
MRPDNTNRKSPIKKKQTTPPKNRGSNQSTVVVVPIEVRTLTHEDGNESVKNTKLIGRDMYEKRAVRRGKLKIPTTRKNTKISA